MFCIWAVVSTENKDKSSENPVSRLQNNLISLESAFQPITNNLIIQQSNTISALPSSLFISSQVLASTFNDDVNSGDKDIIKHTVEKGETLTQIAEKYNISIETILLANEMVSKNIQPGQELLILPINGILHMVEKGETIAQLAKKYSAKEDEILSYNSLSSSDIYVGDILVVPNGKMPKVVTPTKPATPSQSYAQVTLPNSYFIAPTKGIITQGAHYAYSSNGKAYYTAVDISNAIGTPVVAAAAGQVQIVKNVWPYGNYVSILHPNGVISIYAHLSFFGRGIVSGANVSQGQVIGYMGNTGRVIRSVGGNGSHLHFEIRGAANPLTIYGRGTNVSY